jgi:arylsulfatase A
MERRGFLKLSALGAVTSVFGREAWGQAQGRKPSIVLIMADDFGWELPGCYGATSRETPNIDRLAERGIRFDNCYSCPKCVPSRVNIMTGRYGFRTGQKWGYFPPEEVTFGEVLKSAGYATAVAGKWQLGVIKEDPDQITKEGFDEYCLWGWHEGPRYRNPLIWQNGEIREDIEDRYGPDVIVEFLTDFMARNKEKPFLAYYPMLLPHSARRNWGPEEFREPPGPDGEYQTKDELIAKTDEMVGRVVQAVDRLGLGEETLILFTGDNGTSRSVVTEHGDRSIKGGKGKFTDAGTHVPLVARWSGTAPPGTVCDDLIDLSDFLPTFAEVAGADMPEGRTIDGRSFVPQLQGKQGDPRDWVYSQMGDRAWIRTKRWKLYIDGRLYDMENDPMEKDPITPENDSEESSAMRQKLQATLDALRES